MNWLARVRCVVGTVMQRRRERFIETVRSSIHPLLAFKKHYCVIIVFFGKYVIIFF